jgi:hypothetical protein
MMPPELRRGRLLLLIAFAVTLLGDLLTILVKILRVGLTPSSFGSVLRWFITAALLYAIWRGHRWARWLTVGLLGLGLLMIVPVLLQSMHPLVIVVALQFIIALALLAFSPNVAAFINYQRALHSENKKPTPKQGP